MNIKPELNARFKHYVGFVSPPASCDYSAQQFLGLCNDSVGVIQHMAYFEAASYDEGLGDKARRLKHLSDGIAGLKAAEVDIVAQCGGYWSLAYAPTYDEARKLEEDLTRSFRIPVVLNWTAIADALHHVGARRIAVTTGYYRPKWTKASVKFLESAGFDVAWAGDLIDQKIVKDHQAKLEIETATRWDYPDDIVLQTCLDAAQRAKGCDAVCQTGAGMRTSFIAEAFEKEANIPLVATDIAIFWALQHHHGIKPDAGFGELISGSSAQGENDD